MLINTNKLKNCITFNLALSIKIWEEPKYIDIYKKNIGSDHRQDII